MVIKNQSASTLTCLFRRVLAALADKQIVSLAWIRHRFGLDREKAEQCVCLSVENRKT
jgi:hypothetical protein